MHLGMLYPYKETRGTTYGTALCEGNVVGQKDVPWTVANCKSAATYFETQNHVY